VTEGDRVVILPRDHIDRRYHMTRGTLVGVEPDGMRGPSLRVIVDLIITEDGTRIVGETAVLREGDVRPMDLIERIGELAHE